MKNPFMFHEYRYSFTSYLLKKDIISIITINIINIIIFICIVIITIQDKKKYMYVVITLAVVRIVFYITKVIYFRCVGTKIPMICVFNAVILTIATLKGVANQV